MISATVKKLLYDIVVDITSGCCWRWFDQKC